MDLVKHFLRPPAFWVIVAFVRGIVVLGILQVEMASVAFSLLEPSRPLRTSHIEGRFLSSTHFWVGPSSGG